MREELLELYPRVSREQCHVVGSPQFDPYANDDLILSREEFFRRIEADPSRPLICYSGADEYTAPEDQDIARVVMEQVRDGRIHGNPQVLLRPCPVDLGERYAQLRADYPELLYRQPEWKRTSKADYSGWVPMVSDTKFLANLTRHADLNINFGSTMTLDFGLHDCPVINLGFDLTNPPIRGIAAWDMLQWEHYRPVVQLGASRVARFPEQIAEYSNAYLRDPSLDRAGRKALVDLQVGAPLGAASGRVADLLRKLASPTVARLEPNLQFTHSSL